MRSITTTVVLLGTRDTIRKLVKQFRACVVANDRCFPKEKKIVQQKSKTQDSWLASILPISPAVVCIVGVYDNSVGAIVGRGWWLYGGAVKSD